jgi:hypothetical protein
MRSTDNREMATKARKATEEDARGQRVVDGGSCGIFQLEVSARGPDLRVDLNGPPTYQLGGRGFTDAARAITEKSDPCLQKA